ncbi:MULTISPECIES: hypothetical protein [unclassified Microcoleus]
MADKRKNLKLELYISDEGVRRGRAVSQRIDIIGDILVDILSQLRLKAA